MQKLTPTKNLNPKYEIYDVRKNKIYLCNFTHIKGFSLEKSSRMLLLACTLSSIKTHQNGFNNKYFESKECTLHIVMSMTLSDNNTNTQNPVAGLDLIA